MTEEKRTIHAQRGDHQIVRYDKAGKYYLEYVPSRMRPCTQISLSTAVKMAIRMEREGGTIYLGLPGGKSFDRAVTKAKERIAEVLRD